MTLDFGLWTLDSGLLMDIEFELPAVQHELMGHVGFNQGEPVTVTLESDVLVADPAASGWFAVQKEALPMRFVLVGPATYAFTGQIMAAELEKSDGGETAVLLVQCGDIPVRVICGPNDDGRLPFGTWETRYLTGVSRLHGIIEDDFQTAIGKSLDVTIWQLRRLVLAPGDPVFGQWYETDALPPTPYHYDRVIVQCRLHRSRL